MGALIAIAAGLFVLAAATRSRRPSRRRWIGAFLLAVVAVVGAFAAVASFVAAARGDTDDMDPAGVVLLGFVYLAAATGAELAAWRLGRRAPTPTR